MKKGLKIFFIVFVTLGIFGLFMGKGENEKIDTQVVKKIDKDLIQFEIIALRKLLIEEDQLQYLNSNEVRKILYYIYENTYANPKNKEVYNLLGGRIVAFKNKGHVFPAAYFLRALKLSFEDDIKSSFEYGFWMLYDLHFKKGLPLFVSNEFANNNASSLTRRYLWEIRVIAKGTNTDLGIADDKLKELQSKLKNRGKSIALGDITSPISRVLNSGENIKIKDINKILSLYFEFVDRLPNKEVNNYELSKESFSRVITYIYENTK